MTDASAGKMPIEPVPPIPPGPEAAAGLEAASPMSATQTFRELTFTMRPQDPHGDGTGLRFETGEHGGDYPDNMPQVITVTDA
jgi:hypothetical protein